MTERKRIYRHDYAGDAPDPTPLALADEPPPWRTFLPKPDITVPRQPRPMTADHAARGKRHLPIDEESLLVTAALALRRPLLVTGPAGVGKSSLAYSVAWQLGLGNVLRWGVTSRTTLRDGLYQYDALARLHDATLSEKGLPAGPAGFGDYFSLGPLGTALVPTRRAGYFPRVVLVDEVDKSDADLPGDLLHVLEEGSFLIPEVQRLPDAAKPGGVVSVGTADKGDRVNVPGDGVVRCDDFPLVILTSNEDRDFPPAFRRRCLHLEITREQRDKQLRQIILRQLGVEPKPGEETPVEKLLEKFRTDGAGGATLSVDQLLNALFLVRAGAEADVSPLDHDAVMKAVFRSLSDTTRTAAEK